MAKQSIKLAQAASSIRHAYWAASVCFDENYRDRYEAIPENQHNAFRETEINLRRRAHCSDENLQLTSALSTASNDESLAGDTIRFCENFVGLFNDVADKYDDTAISMQRSALNQAIKAGIVLNANVVADLEAVGASNLATACRKLGFGV